MPQSQFDPDKGVNFKGEFLSIEVLDPAAATHTPNLVVDPTLPFEIKVKWKIEGNEVPLYLAALDASWSVEAFAESIGPGPEVRLAVANVAKGAGTGTATLKNYEATLTVPAGTLQEGNPFPGSPSGVYKIVVTAFLNSSIGAPGFDIAGFGEGPLIRAESPI
jgi:hypothetical protein